MKNKLIKTICIFTSICLIFPAPVRAAQGTPRIPNDAISIYSTELSYDLRDQNGNTIWDQNGTVKYEGKPIEITAYPPHRKRTAAPRKLFFIHRRGECDENIS